MYWSGLILVPLLGMYIVRKQKDKKTEGGMSKPIAYLLWLCGGFVGLHRFYVRSNWGLIYIPLFILLLMSNSQVRNSMNLVSKEKNEVISSTFLVERAQKRIDKSKATILRIKDRLEASTDSSEQASLKRREDRAQKKLSRDQTKLDKTKQTLESAKQNLTREEAGYSKWTWITRIIAIVIGILLLIDAYLIPGLVDKCAEMEAREDKKAKERISMPSHEPGTGESPTLGVHSKYFDYVDKVNGYVGEFVCFWSIIAVFVYYYEVVGRYLFNSPTNWAHESMFLMFGMQYVLAAGFTNREDAHVRVDVIYQFFPTRLKGLVDVFTSIFFFIFAVALLWTGWVFAADSMKVWEVSFTEWAIQYWPVKATLVIGAILLILDGLTKLFKDIYVLVGKKV